jgi:hypothetical protein
MMHTQFLVFEIGRKCNYAGYHAGMCPSGEATRYGRLDTSTPMTDDQIVESAAMAYGELGFVGLVGFHFYNEPCLYFDRISTVFGRILDAVPEARAVLWTNGTRLPDELDRLRIFEQIWVTDYLQHDWTFLERYVPVVNVVPDNLDHRNQGHAAVDDRRCLRMFNELILDYYGNGHICCIDFRGDCYLGNIHREGFAEIAKQFLTVRDQVIQYPMPVTAPAVCRLCAVRLPEVGRLVPEVWRAAQQYATTEARVR